MQLFRVYEELQYERAASILVARLIDPLVTLYLIDGLDVTVSKVRLERPFDHLSFSANHRIWSKDQDFEIRLPQSGRGRAHLFGLAQCRGSFHY